MMEGFAIVDDDDDDGEVGEYATEVWGWAQRIISNSGCIYGAWNASAKLF